MKICRYINNSEQGLITGLQVFERVPNFLYLDTGKAVPLQARSGPESSRKLRFPDYMTTAQDGGKVVSPTHRPPLPPGNAPDTHFCYRLDPRAIVRSEGFYVNEKSQ